MQEQLLLELARGQASTMMALEAVAVVFASTLVKKGILTKAEAQAMLLEVVEEVRDDGEHEVGKTAVPSNAIAASLERRALALSK